MTHLDNPPIPLQTHKKNYLLGETYRRPGRVWSARSIGILWTVPYRHAVGSGEILRQFRVVNFDKNSSHSSPEIANQGADSQARFPEPKWRSWSPNLRHAGFHDGNNNPLEPQTAGRRKIWNSDSHWLQKSYKIHSISFIFQHLKVLHPFRSVRYFRCGVPFCHLGPPDLSYHYRRAETISQSLKPEGEVWRCLTEVKKVYGNHWVRQKIEKHS